MNVGAWDRPKVGDVAVARGKLSRTVKGIDDSYPWNVTYETGGGRQGSCRIDVWVAWCKRNALSYIRDDRIWVNSKLEG